MAEISIPQQGTTVGDATQAPYSADEFSLYQSKIIGFGAMRDDNGVVRGSGTSTINNVLFGLDVVQDGVNLAIVVSPGTAMVKGTMYENTSDKTLSVTANASGSDRLDTLILRKDYVAQTVRLVVLPGTPSGSPEPPTLTQVEGTTWEIPIVDIPVANGATSLNSNLFVKREGFINDPDRIVLDGVINDSGGELVTGDVVTFSPAASTFGGGNIVAFTTSIVNHPNAFGVWIGRTPDNGIGRVLVRGVGFVNLASVVGSGEHLITHNALKKARALTPSGGLYYTIGQLLDIGSVSNTYALAYINPRAIGMDYVRIVDSKAQNTAGGGFTNGAWRTRDLNTLQYDTPFSDTVTLAANVFTLAKPGFYIIRASAPAHAVDGHQVRLNNNTGGTTFEGTSEYAPTGVQSRSFVEARFILTASAAFTLEHRCITTKATDGLGRQVNLAAEQYSVVEIWHTALPNAGA